MRALIVLRCGTGSLHKSWIVRARALYDTAFVYFDDADFSADGPTYSAAIRGTKYTGIRDFFLQNPEILERYDYFWLLEDDLFVGYETLLGMLDFVERIRPVLCAPSLSPESYYTHPVMIQNDALVVRGTDFVECMAPMMSRAFLRQSLDQFAAYPIYGIERYWQHLLWEMREVAYILDSCPIVHTRPVGGGGLYQLEALLGIDKFHDDLAAGEKYGQRFNRYVNTLFGVSSAGGIPALVVGSELIDRYRAGAARFLQLEASSRTAIEQVVDHTGFTNPFFSRFLTFDSVRRLLYLREFTELESDLIVRDWTFGSSRNGDYAESFLLRPSGRIGGYVNDNEYEWRMDGPDLLLLSRAGQVTTRFTDLSVIDGKMVLQGRYSDQEDVFHYLREH